MRFSKIYVALKRFGFSPAKAAEVVLDAQRGDAYARWFVGRAFVNRKAPA